MRAIAGQTYAECMQLRVLFFGVLRDTFGSEEMLEQFPGRTVADVVSYYRVLSPELALLWEKIAVAVNQQYARGSAELHAGDEVALLPPVSGGSDAVLRADVSYKSRNRLRIAEHRGDVHAS